MISDGEMSFGSLHEELMNGMKSGWTEYLENEGSGAVTPDDYADLLRKIENKSIWMHEKRKTRKKGKAVFPYYNLDLSYNVMKRVRVRIKENTLLGGKNLYDYFSTVYSYVAEELKSEENEYKKFMDSKKIPDFYKSFVESSFVQLFDLGNGEKQERLDKRFFNDIFAEVFRKLTLSKVLVPDIEEQNITE